METEWLHAQDLEQRRDVADAVDAADGRDSALEQRWKVDRVLDGLH
jgi:hypothetical protein